MKLRFCALAFALPVLLGGCGIGDTDRREGRLGDEDRVLVPLAVDTLWSIGEEADSTFAYLWSPVSAPTGGLYIADVGNVKLHRISENGELLWSYGTRGQGPGELQETRVFDVDVHGNVVILDNPNRRITTISPNGEMISESPFPVEIGYTAAVAALDNGDLAVAHLGGPWTLLSKAGEFLAHVTPPWSDVADKHFLEIVGQSRPVRGSDRWVYSLDAAGEWFVFTGSDVQGRYSHVENVPFAEVMVSRTENGGSQARYQRRPIFTTADLALRGDTLFVLFFGTSRYSGRIIDKYDVNTGGYIESLLLPNRTTGVTFGRDNTMFAASDSRLFHTVSALRYKGDVP